MKLKDSLLVPLLLLLGLFLCVWIHSRHAVKVEQLRLSNQFSRNESQEFQQSLLVKPVLIQSESTEILFVPEWSGKSIRMGFYRITSKGLEPFPIVEMERNQSDKDRKD